MIPVSLLVTYLYILNVQNVIGVRIFKNVLPTPHPSMNIPYKPHVLSKTCLLKPQRGPCRAGIEMYYYNATEGACKIFKWGGCQGNGNRFDTEDECLERCLSKKDGPKRAPKWCSLTFDYGFCFGALERYFYDRVWKTCKKTIYSGCGGNRNNFFFKAQCESICLFRTGPIETKTTTRSKIKKALIVNPGPTTVVMTPSTNATTEAPCNKDKDKDIDSDSDKETEKKNSINVL